MIGRLISYLLTFCMFFGCQKKPVTTPSQRILQISFTGDITSLDPRKSIDSPTVYAIKMLFEGLICIDLEGNLQPALAERYEISDDQKTYIFYLRHSLWSNGDPVTAYDFEYAWKKVIDPSTQNSGAHNFYCIKNVKKIAHKELPMDQVGFKALNDHTFIVELEHPANYFLEILANSSFFPVNKKLDIEDHDWALKDSKNFVSNGPFLLKHYKINNEILVLKNPLYWQAEKVKLPGIRISIIPDSNTQLNLFEKGELDWIGEPLSKIPFEAIDQLKQQGKITWFPSLGLSMFTFNVHTFPFQNKKMRQAFHLALNREEITKTILQVGGKPATGVLPYQLATQETPYILPIQDASAIIFFEESLKELGLTRETLPTIVLHYPNLTLWQKIAEIVQQQWHKAFGIWVKLQQQDWKAYHSKLIQGDFQMGVVGWQSWIRDPIYTLGAFRFKQDRINVSKWENVQYQNLLASSEEELDPQKRKEIFHQAEKILIEELPFTPIYFNRTAFAKNNALKNYYISDLQYVDFRWAYFEELQQAKP